MVDGELYKKAKNGSLLKCVTPSEAVTFWEKFMKGVATIIRELELWHTKPSELVIIGLKQLKMPETWSKSVSHSASIWVKVHSQSNPICSVGTGPSRTIWTGNRGKEVFDSCNWLFHNVGWSWVTCNNHIQKGGKVHLTEHYHQVWTTKGPNCW